MADIDPIAAATVRAELEALRACVRSLALATVGAETIPEASYAPFVNDTAGNLYVYVSALARHTRNLEQTHRVGVLMIEDEARAANPFARRRLTYSCQAAPVERDSGPWLEILQTFRDRFGPVIDTLRGLPDFQLFRLTPVSGTYVRGFGQTYRLAGPGMDTLVAVQPPGG